MASEEGNVLVVVRVRPLSQQEQEGNQHRVVQVVDPSMLILNPEEPEPTRIFAGVRVQEPPKRKTREQKFVFDHVFGEAAGQQEVFQHITKDILDGVLNGYNCSVFAYGATGAGKTHTMLGDERDPGIMYLTMIELYRRMEEQEDKQCEVLISYLEVYNEQIQDLLEPQGPLAIREDPQKGVVVQGLSFHQPDSAKHLLQMLARGNKNRTQHPTDANATSSRSHAVFQIHVKQQDRALGLSQDFRVAKMSLIDLAGSERASTTNARGERLREGSNINRSLLALINVINALADAKSRKSHVPYRDSKLTRLLKDSIGGNCRTVMITAISPSSRSYDDTYNTLRYANRAKEIKLSPKSNVVSVECPMCNYAAVCKELKAEVMELREKLKAYESSQSPAALKMDPQAQTCFRLKEPPVRETLPGCESEGTEQLTEMDQVGLQESHLSSFCCSLKSRNSLLLEHKDLKAARGRLDYSQMEMLLGVLLRVVRRQHCVLKGTGLCTPEMTMEIEEVESLLRNDGCATWKERLETQDTRTKPKPSEIIPNQELQLQLGKVTAPRHPPQKRCRREESVDLSLSPNTPVVPLKKRQRPDSSTPCGAGCRATIKLRAKQPNSAQSSGGISSKCAPVLMLDNSTSSEGSSSFKKVMWPLQRASPCTPKLDVQEPPNFCSSAVTKRRKPLATSALQNFATSVQTVPAAALAVQDVNATFDVLEENRIMAFNASPILCWENVGCNWKDADSTSSFGSKIAVFSAKGPLTRLRSSTPRSLSSITRCSTKKRQRSVNGLTAPQSRIARLQNSTIKRPQSQSERSYHQPKWQSNRRAWRGSVTQGPMLRGLPAAPSCQLPSFPTVILS